MLIIPAGVKIHLALGRTDMRKGFDSLAVLVQEVLKKDPFSGHLFAFRGKKADTMKVLFWDGNGLCLFTKRLQQGRFIWPSLCDPGGTVTLTPAQLAIGCGAPPQPAQAEVPTSIRTSSRGRCAGSGLRLGFLSVRLQRGFSAVSARALSVSTSSSPSASWSGLMRSDRRPNRAR
jgi:transposase